MTQFDTPAGRFRILLNGEPTEFILFQGKPVTFRTESNAEIFSTNSYVACIDITNLEIYDIVSGVLESHVLYYSGCIAGIESLMCHIHNCTFELSTPYTEDYEDDKNQRFLPYESYSYNGHGFAMRIVDRPCKFTESPMQKEIVFLIAWAYTDEKTWSSQATSLM